MSGTLPFGAFRHLAKLTAGEPRRGRRSSGPKVETAEGRRHFKLSPARVAVRAMGGRARCGTLEAGQKRSCGWNRPRQPMPREP